jgi:putative ATP-dependent endonuclease of OLD family
VRNLLGAVELGESLAVITAAIEALHGAVHDAPALIQLREGLASALADLLPYDVTSDDLSFALPRADETDPLADVDVKFAHGGTARSLRDQSDGMRAMSTVAIQLLAKQAGNIVGVDEPEIHLHPRAQARVGALLRDKAAQSVIATHSPAVLTQYSPMHALAFVGGSCRQLPSEPFAGDPKAAEHWWTTPALEPLTCRGAILVEGVADRVIIESVAAAMSLDLDRLGVVVAAVNGAGGFKMSLRLFGSTGFGVPLVGLVDMKEAADVAGYLNIPVIDLPAAGFVVCDPDLEAECVKGLGAAEHARLLCASGMITKSRICKANGVTALTNLVEGPYAEWCRSSKTEIAVALGSVLGAAEVTNLATLSSVVSLIISKLP